MKKLKFLVLFLLLVSSVIFAVGCTDNQANLTNPTKLSTPVLMWENGLIKWEAIDNASKYEVSINDQIIYTYKTQIELEISTTKRNYKVKVKSISESADFLNSDFSDVLDFETVKLSSPTNLRYEIDNNSHKVNIIWSITDYNADIYQLKINEKIYNLSANLIEIKENTNTSFVSNNLLCKYTINGELFDVGINEISMQARSFNKYFLSSDITNSLRTLYKNPQLTNIRVKDGTLKYGDNNVYDTSIWDAIIDTEPFAVINKENSSETVLWSDPSYVNIYKIHAPQIIECEKSTSGILVKLQGYDPSFVGDDKRDIGYDYDKIEIRIYCTISSSPFCLYVDSKCLDEETLFFNYSDISSSWFDQSKVYKFEIIAHKNGYIDSKEIEYKF